MRRALINSRLFVLLAFLSIPTILHAAWPLDGLVIANEDYDQTSPKVVSDGAGGAIIAWSQGGSSYNTPVYAQRVDGAGNHYWPRGGVQISIDSEVFLLAMVSDEANGAIILYLWNGTIYAHRIDGAGASVWAEPVEITSDYWPDQLVAEPDGAGGVIVALQFSGLIYAEKVDHDGNVAWDPAARQCVQISDESSGTGGSAHDPAIAADGSGGAIVAFVLDRAFEPGSRIYLNRVLSSGNIWAVQDIEVDADIRDQYNPAITCDEQGTSYVVWQHETSMEFAVNLQKFDGSGNPEFPFPVHVGPPISLPQRHPDILADGSGGAYIVWDGNDGSSYRVFGERIDSLGNSLWGTKAISADFVGLHDAYPKLLKSSEGPIVVWRSVPPEESLAAQKLDITGGPLWGVGGISVLGGRTEFGDFGVAADSGGGLFAGITKDPDEGTGLDIYLQSINALGHVAAPEPAITAVEDVPGDQGGAVRITVSASDRDDNAQTVEQVTRYDVWQLVAAKAVAPSGDWELIGSFDATQDAGYVYRATTLADSSAAGVFLSTYAVTAHTTNPAVWFFSAPVSGYSVDNIAPGAPQGVAAAYAADRVDLDWGDSPESDFQYYRVYRDTDAGFSPSPANLVQEIAVSAWTDPASDPWSYHYKITALDAAGNESEAGSPSSMSGAQGNVAPARTTLLGAVPNPFNPSTRLSFELAADDRARLEIYDVAGRRVVTLLDEQRAAGPHWVTWDGRDSAGRASAAGIYFYRLTAGPHSETKRMVLVK